MFSEYLVAQTDRVRKAAGIAIRFIISKGLSTQLFDFHEESKAQSDLQAILSLDALTISEEVDNIRNDRLSKKKMSAKDKLLINVCYMLSVRFQPCYDIVLKLIAAFIQKVGKAISKQQVRELLHVVSELKIYKEHYN